MDRGAVGLENGAVAGTISGAVRMIPGYCASFVRTAGRERVNGAAVVAPNCDLLVAMREDAPFAGCNLGKAFNKGL